MRQEDRQHTLVVNHIKLTKQMSKLQTPKFLCIQLMLIIHEIT